MSSLNSSQQKNVEHLDGPARVIAGAGDVDAAEATRLLIGRLLHAPSEALRR